jgi:hypothetical protein
MLLNHPAKDLSLKMPSILEDMAYVPLIEPVDPFLQRPRALKMSQSTILASHVIQATQHRASQRWKSSERRCPHGLRAWLLQSQSTRSAHPQNSLSAPRIVREKSFQGNAASSEPSEDEVEHPWYHGSNPEDLAQFREAFIHDVELWRMQQRRYTPVPRMPSMLNPVRKDAPPRSWIYLENPYPSCPVWTMTNSILARRERSR